MKLLQSLSRIKASFLLGVKLYKGDLSDNELHVSFDDDNIMPLDEENDEEEETSSLEEINDELDSANNELDEMIKAGNKARH